MATFNTTSDSASNTDAIKFANLLNDFWVHLGVQSLEVVVGEGSSLTLVFAGVMLPVQLASVLSEYNHLVNDENYTPADAISIVGTAFSSGLAAGAGTTAFFSAMDLPWLGAAIAPLAMHWTTDEVE